MAAIKHSKQRDAIKNFLVSRKDHPTAEVVYAHVSREFPNISLGTVYRNLSFLVDLGQASKVPCSDGSVHFDGNISPHYHFQCRECNAIIDLDFDIKKTEEDFISAASENFDGVIDGNVSFFYGTCPECHKKLNLSKNRNNYCFLLTN